MKKYLGIVCAVIMAVVVLSNCALSANHQAIVGWGASSTAGATYNVYKANCLGTVTNGVCSQEGAFTLVGNVPNSQLSYTDLNVTAGSGYVYYITAACDATTNNCGTSVVGESAPSTHIAATIPKDRPGAPSSPTINAS